MDYLGNVNVSRGGGHDPVAAISEAEATGETAAIFADIRRTMQIPMITSIWRTLVDIEGGLSATWEVTKPLYETGQPAAALMKLRTQAVLPVPEPLAPGQLSCAGVREEELPVIRALIEAYNRSNGMNLMALTGLVVTPSGAPSNAPVPPDPPPWPELPPLPAPADIPADIWTLLRHINRFGAVPGEEGLATIWRHMAHWPGLLAVIYAGLAPLQRDGTIQRSKQQILEIAQAEGKRLAHLHPEIVPLPEAARQMITNYVLDPGLVARMVTIGHGLARWLQPPNEQA
jgi:hypothetical protein